MDRLNSRILWIDELKGFILVLVCLSHLGGDHYAFLQITRLMRMPTFFFLSGMLFSRKKYNTTSKYLTHKFDVLLFPYITLSFFFALFSPSFINSITQGHFFSFLSTQIEWIFVAGLSSTYSMPLWFVWVLFAVSCIFFLITKHFSSKFSLSIFAMISLITGWACNYYNFKIPMRIDSMATALYFFAMGHICKDILREKVTNFNKQTLIILCLLLGLTYMFIYFLADSYIDLCINRFTNNIFLFILETFIGIFLAIHISILFSKSEKRSIQYIRGILRNISRNALIILGGHWYTFSIYKYFFSNYKDYLLYDFFNIVIVILSQIILILLFRNKLYFLIGKKQISCRESLSID